MTSNDLEISKATFERFFAILGSCFFLEQMPTLDNTCDRAKIVKSFLKFLKS